MIPRSFYFHVPFCARRCFYCDFAVEANREPPSGEWIAAVAEELAIRAREQAWPSPLPAETLYVGGGTPSLLGSDAMASFRSAIAPHVVITDDTEWTCEANPESFTPKLAEGWRTAGVNRLSLGLQTFNASALRWMGRLHGPDGGPRAVDAARAAGFTNISIDLIFALPEHLDRDWSEDVQRAISLGVEHLSLYGLTAEVGAPLGRWVREGRERLPVEDVYASQYRLAAQELTRAGFEHYEVSNFSRPGRRSRHNSVYWTGDSYEGVGPAAHSFQSPVRRWNLRNWREYRQAVTEGLSPVESEEMLDDNSLLLERIWLSLRTAEGLCLSDLPSSAARMGEHWVERGFADGVGASISLNPEGWLVLDELAVEMDRAVGRSASKVRIDADPPLVQIPQDPNTAY